jgi:hypothetical protein
MVICLSVNSARLRPVGLGESQRGEAFVVDAQRAVASRSFSEGSRNLASAFGAANAAPKPWPARAAINVQSVSDSPPTIV